MNRFECKFATDDVAQTGEFSGYGAVFGNVDSHGDVIMPGAFKTTLDKWQEEGRLPPMRLMHGTALNMFSGDDLPIGKWTEMREDERGLFVKGKLSALDTDMGRRVYGLMKDGVLDGLSIGFRALKKTAVRGQGPVKRQLEQILLSEISLVDQPSNGLARVQGGIKSLSDLTVKDMQEIEASLRDDGLSRKDAVTAVSGFKKWFQRDADTPTTDLRDEGAADELAEILRRNTQLLSSKR